MICSSDNTLPQIAASSEQANFIEASEVLLPIAVMTSAYSFPILAITDTLLSLCIRSSTSEAY